MKQYWRQLFNGYYNIRLVEAVDYPALLSKKENTLSFENTYVAINYNADLYHALKGCANIAGVQPPILIQDILDGYAGAWWDQVKPCYRAGYENGTPSLTAKPAPALGAGADFFKRLFQSAGPMRQLAPESDMGMSTTRSVLLPNETIAFYSVVAAKWGSENQDVIKAVLSDFVNSETQSQEIVYWAQLKQGGMDRGSER
jgi:hypothetical protein